MADLTTIIEYYRDNPIDFVIYCLEMEPTNQQEEILNAVRDYRFVAVSSGRGIGKSLVAAFTIWWFLCTRYKPQVPTTAPTASTLNDVLWSRLADCYDRLSPVFKSQFVMTSDRIYHINFKKQWFAVARTARAENPEALQGFHADHMLLVADEAAGIPENTLTSALNSFTQPENYGLLISNPNRLSGMFYDIFHSINKWHTLTFSAEDSPLVSQEWLDSMAQQYGKDSGVYDIHVRGRFPTSENSTLIDLYKLEEATKREVEVEGQVYWGVGVARFGDDKSALCIRRGNSVLSIETFSKKSTMELVGIIANRYRTTEEKPVSIFVDVIGVGGGVVDRLAELNLPVVSVNVGNRSNEPDKYMRLRDELWDKFKQWINSDMVSIPPDRELIQQSAAIRFKFDSSGKMQIERKEDFKKRNPRLGSPDLADAVCLTFYEGNNRIYDVVF